jgi:hypothetical protein
LSAKIRRSGRSLVPWRLGLLLAAAASLAALALGVALADASAPTVTVAPASAVSYLTAHVEGTVDPGAEPTTWRFQYVTEAQFQENLTDSLPGFEGAATGLEGQTETAEPLSGELTGLAANTTYHLRLFAENGSGPAEAVAASTFTTKEVAAPVVTIDEASAVSYTTASAEGTVELSNPDPAFDASCAFQYISEAQFQENLTNSVAGFEGAGATACAPETVLGTEAQPVTVTGALTALEPSTTYHLRLVATDAGGPGTAVAASTFTTKAVAKPVVSIEPVSSFTSTTASLIGHVDPAGTDPAFDTTWQFECTPECPVNLGTGGEIPADEASHEVTSSPAGLEPNTGYTITLAATNLGGTQTATTTFTTATAPPAVSATGGEADGHGGVTLSGFVDPRNSAISSCVFEYGATEGYGQSTSCEGGPLTGGAPIPVSADVTGLEPGATYHFRITAVGVAGTTHSTDAEFEVPAGSEPVCPNAQLRAESDVNPETGRSYSSELPDCRAFELVTPAFKALSLAAAGHFAGDGSRLFTTMTSSVAGSSSSLIALSNEYELTRSSSGWHTTALFPLDYLPTDFQVGGVTATDAGAALIGLRRPGGPEFEDDIYLRSPAGELTEVGPMISPSGVGLTSSEVKQAEWEEAGSGGASADLSHVIFGFTTGENNSNNPLILGLDPRWPGDTTHQGVEEQTLYEYSGTGNTEPVLVGVRNVGSVAAAAATEHTEHLNEAAELLSRCGTRLGAGSNNSTLNEPVSEPGTGNTHNAVSADGEAVFFTSAHCGEEMPSNELFARLGGVRTLAVSSPAASEYPPAQGEGPGPDECDSACHSAEPKEGIFQGASRDGRKVFFLTRQPLLNGDTDDARDLYMAEIEGRGESARLARLVQVSRSSAPDEAAEVQGVGSLSEDGSHVYFVAKGVLTGGEEDEYGAAALPGAENLYDYDTVDGRLTFVATLSAQDDPAPLGEWQFNGGHPMQTTPDGHFLLFTSHADVTPDDTSTASQVFRYDSLTGRLTRISVGEEGREEDGNASGSAAVPTPSFATRMKVDADDNPAISDDGSTVVFESHGALTAGAVRGRMNYYEYSGGSVHLLVPPGADGGILGIDRSGRDIFFSTEKALVPEDQDSAEDYYDARVEGGFPAPAAAPGCEGEACRSGPATRSRARLASGAR